VHAPLVPPGVRRELCPPVHRTARPAACAVWELTEAQSAGQLVSRCQRCRPPPGVCHLTAMGAQRSLAVSPAGWMCGTKQAFARHVFAAFQSKPVSMKHIRRDHVC
jgi:hypothetical protein